MSKALEGVRIIEFGHVLAAPFCCSILADFGADVIKIEEPKAGDAIRRMTRTLDASWAIENRNKRAITLDIKSEEGKEIFLKLLEEADVLIENHRPGTMEKYGFGWEEVHKINPKIILTQISGYGQTGPYKDKPGYDSIGLAMGGLTYITGSPDRPPMRPGVAIGDYVTGLFAAIGTLVALYNRDQVGNGEGQMVDSSLVESVLRMSEDIVPEYGFSGFIKERIGAGHTGTIPSGNFETKDGKWVAMAVGSDPLFFRFLKCIGRMDLKDDPDYNTMPSRHKNRPAVDQLAKDWIKEHTYKECEEILGKEIPFSLIYSSEDIFQDPHYRERDSIVAIPDPRFKNNEIVMPGVFPVLSKTPGEIRWPGPDKGAYNDEVLQELGYTKEEIEVLKQKGVI